MIQGQKDNRVYRPDCLPGNTAPGRGKSGQKNLSPWESLSKLVYETSRGEDFTHRDCVNPNRARTAQRFAYLTRIKAEPLRQSLRKPPPQKEKKREYRQTKEKT
jgi:hypothetical protein